MSNKSRTRINREMIFLMLAIGITGTFFSERVELFNGHNWDALSYVAWIKNFFYEIFEKGVSNYEVQRIFPPIAIHYGMRLFGLPLQEPNILFAYQIWNLASLLLSVYLWGKISNCLNLTHRGKWLGFFGLFINYPILKLSFYYPLLSDTTAFTLGMMSFYFYLTQRPRALLMTALLGAFAWSTIFLFGLLLFFFSDWKDQNRNSAFKKPKQGVWAAAFMTLLVLGFIIKIIVKTGFFVHMTKMHVYQTPNLPVLNLSILLVLGYIFFAYYHLFNATPISWRALWKKFSLRKFFIAAGCFVLVQWIIHSLAAREHLATPIRFIYRNHTLAISNPLIFGIAHAVYYGPILILTVFLWKPLCRVIQPYGIGLILMVWAGLFLGLGSESRQWTNFMLIFIAFTCKVIDGLEWKNSYYWLIGVGQFLYSKVWFLINPLGAGSDHGNVLIFPYQKYYLSHGPFMSDIMYVAQGSMVGGTAFLFYLVLFRKSKVTSSP